MINYLKINKTYLYSYAYLLNIAVCLKLKLSILLSEVLDNEWYFNHPSIHELNSKNKLTAILAASDPNSQEQSPFFSQFDSCLAILEKGMNHAKSTYAVFDKEELANFQWYEKEANIMSRLKDVIDELFEKGRYEEAFEFLSHMFDILKKASNDDELREILGDALYSTSNEDLDYQHLAEYVHLTTAACLTKLNRVQDVKPHLLAAMMTFYLYSIDIETLQDRIEYNYETWTLDYGRGPKKDYLYFTIGSILFKLGDIFTALSYLQLALGIGLSESENYWLDDEDRTMLLYCGIGNCLFRLREYQESENYLKIAIDFIKELGNMKDTDGVMTIAFNRGVTYNCLGKSLMEQGKYKEALPELQKAVDILKETLDSPLDKNMMKRVCMIGKKEIIIRKKAKEIADFCYDLGRCQMELNRFKEAANYLQYSLIIRTEQSQEETSTTRLQLLSCLMEQYQRNSIEKVLKEHRETPTFNRLKSSYLTYTVELRQASSRWTSQTTKYNQLIFLMQTKPSTTLKFENILLLLHKKM